MAGVPFCYSYLSRRNSNDISQPKYRRVRTQARLQAARVRLVQAEEVLVAKTKAAARATDAYVHESPWVAVGVAAGMGVLVGLLLGRR